MSIRLVPELRGFEIEKITCLGNRVIVHATAIREEAHCPICGTATTQVHSRYIRTSADLPYGGKSVQLRLTVRRFSCPNPTCYRKTFAERLPELVPVNGQRTQRASEGLTEVAFACGGELGAHLSVNLGMEVSPLIRLMRNRRSRVWWSSMTGPSGKGRATAPLWWIWNAISPLTCWGASRLRTGSYAKPILRQESQATAIAPWVNVGKILGSVYQDLR